MLFSSDERVKVCCQRFRVHLWPRRSFGRSGQYFWKRILRLRATPHAIAAGVAAGVFAAFLPFLGLHILIAAALAWLLRGNMLAAALGTAAVGNPLTFPLIWAATYAGGRFLLHAGPASAARLHIGEPLRHMDFRGFVAPGAGADDRRRRSARHRRRLRCSISQFAPPYRPSAAPGGAQVEAGRQADGRAPETPPVSQS